MSVAKSLLERFGLMAGAEASFFETRLARIGRRERRIPGMPILFRNRLSHSAA